MLRTKYSQFAQFVFFTHISYLRERQLQLTPDNSLIVTKEVSMRFLSWLAMLASFVAGVIATALYS